jgi:hypothetical protein
MKFLNIVVYEAIAAAAVGRNKNKKLKGKRNVRVRDTKRWDKKTSVGSLLLLSIVHLRRWLRLITMRIQNRDVVPADPTSQGTGNLWGSRSS